MLGYDEDDRTQDTITIQRIDKTELIEELKIPKTEEWKH